MKNIILTFALIFTASAISLAQYGSVGTTDARSMGMGNTANAVSKSVFSIGINPANVLHSDETINFSTLLPIPSVSAKAGTNFISINDYNYYFGGVNGKARILTESDKQHLNSLFSSGGLVIANTTFNLFSIVVKADQSVGSFGFSINDVVEGNFTVPHALSELALNGNAQNSVFNFNDTKAEAWWIRDYSFTYAREIPEVNLFSSFGAGISLKMVQGFAFVQSQNVNSSIQTTDQNQIILNGNNEALSAFSADFGVKYSFDSTSDKSSNMGPFPTPAGTGFGIDLGLNASLNNTWQFAFSITDIGSINWNQNTASTSSTGQYTISDLQTASDSVKDKFKGVSDSTGGFSTNLPTALRLGASYKFNSLDDFGTLLLAMDINQGFNDMPGNSTKTRVSIGAEWKPMDWVPYIRTGFSFGGLTGFHWGLGLGIDAGLLEFNLSTLDMQTLVAPNSGKYISVAFNSLWKF